MRLVNTTTFNVETFQDGQIPAYAILSHRWMGDGEVTIQDIAQQHRQWMPAWSKITMSCQQACLDGLGYIWIDTCCIDKSSSAELSEAINSMYKWYASAKKCYAYLNDVCLASSDPNDHKEFGAGITCITYSKWFTRSWTLQELIAPTELDFYDVGFSRLGSRADFAQQIDGEKRIPRRVLEFPLSLPEYSVATKMSWAADRRASRIEDIAYSLFGLFSVNLPLLYGEGSRAFTRLQEEIIRQTHDHSIFLWSSKANGEEQSLAAHESSAMRLLANSPLNFTKFSGVQIDTVSKISGEIRPYALTNIGLQVELKIFPYDLDVYVGILNCYSSTGKPYGILLTRQDKKATIWNRARIKGVEIVEIKQHVLLKQRLPWRKMYIARELEFLRAFPNPFYGIHIYAPAFLACQSLSDRQYALIAYYDWHYTVDVEGADQETEDFLSRRGGHTAEPDSRLTPISHINQTLSLEQTLALTGFIKSSAKRKRTRTDSDGGSVQRPCDIKPSTSNRDRDKKGPDDHEVTRLALGVLAMPLMTTGTAGLVAFDHHVHGIKAIKAGFDSDFRPIVLIATYEAESHPQISTWLSQDRFMDLRKFEYQQKSLENRDESLGDLFWNVNADQYKDVKSFTHCEDGSILICKGVFAFTCPDESDREHWIFKPHERWHWHIAIGLDKRIQDGLVYWELTMDKRNDLVVIVETVNQGISQRKRLEGHLGHLQLAFQIGKAQFGGRSRCANRDQSLACRRGVKGSIYMMLVQGEKAMSL